MHVPHLKQLEKASREAITGVITWLIADIILALVYALVEEW